MRTISAQQPSTVKQANLIFFLYPHYINFNLNSNNHNNHINKQEFYTRIFLLLLNTYKITLYTCIRYVPIVLYGNMIVMVVNMYVQLGSVQGMWSNVPLTFLIQVNNINSQLLSDHWLTLKTSKSK